jgi:beta-phosphoglucomutase-like phosphatase (HAD superfamily)
LTAASTRPFDAIVFDLGGVFIELGGVARMLELLDHRITDEMQLAPQFAMHFASHLLGLLKPDRAIFEHVVERLGYAPERILFLDDTTVNVESARSVGISAYRVVGLEGVIEQLREVRVLPLPS